MGTNKTIREMTGFLQGLNCDVVVVKSKTHIKYYAKKAEHQKLFITSASASDRRAGQNIRAEFKRWLRTIETTGANHAQS